MDLDDPWQLNLDETNFLFQIDQSPLPCVTTPATDCRFKPGPSTEFTDGDLESNLPFGSPLSPFLSYRTWSHEDKVESRDPILNDGPSTGPLWPDTFFKSDCPEEFSPPVVHTSPVRSATLDATSSHAGPTDDLISGRSPVRLTAIKCESDIETTSILVKSALSSPRSTPFIPGSPSSWKSVSESGERTVKEEPRYDVENHFAPTDHHKLERSTSNLSADSLSFSLCADQSAYYSMASRQPSTSRRFARCGSILKPFNVDQCEIKRTPTLNQWNLAGSSSDSELDYHSMVEMRYNYFQPNRTKRMNSSGSGSHISSGCQESIDTSNEQLEPRFNSPSITSNTGSLRKWARHLRDKDALLQAKVPFSYEEIVHSTNDRFRELKTTPCLTEQQLNMMLDARKRATNRMAAERSRRSKTVARDVLSDRLAMLRRERHLLQRQVAQARQRKQDANEALLLEQKRVLSLLCGPEGDQLRYSDWRVRLTNEDEVVVVAVGR